MTKEIEEIESFIEESRIVRMKIIESLLDKLTEISETLASSIQGGK